MPSSNPRKSGANLFAELCEVGRSGGKISSHSAVKIWPSGKMQGLKLSKKIPTDFS